MSHKKTSVLFLRKVLFFNFENDFGIWKTVKNYTEVSLWDIGYYYYRRLEGLVGIRFDI
jgi:hypothetical protein